jgi:drug/metabolite transporter (DMT)-like permease
VTLISDALQRRPDGLHLLTAALAMAGTALVKGGSLFQGHELRGFLLVQASNLCFAFGQIYFVRVLKDNPQVSNRQVFGLLYLGGALVAGAAAAIFTPWAKLSLSPLQAGTLLYLGGVASGLSFFLWNTGARRVNAGALAIFNDLKIPLAVAVSLAFFGEQADLQGLLSGGAIILARKSRPETTH